MVVCKSQIATIQLSDSILSLAVAPDTKIGIQEYRSEIRPLLNWSSTSQWNVTDTDIRSAIGSYSDVYMGPSSNPMADLRSYIAARFRLLVYGVGGNWWHLLGYKQRPKLAPAELIGGIGEAVSGYWLENRMQMIYLLRPVGVSTDGIIQDNQGVWGPIEVKTTVGSSSYAQEKALSASRLLLKLYAHHEFVNRNVPQSTLGLAFSIGVRLSNQIEVFCIEFRR